MSENKSSAARKVLELETQLVQERLRESAQAYADIYQEDGELRTLTEQALNDWPD